MSRALVTAYAASVARVASWAVAFAIVYRAAGDRGAAQVALLALARSTVGLLGYLSLGTTPVLVRMLTRPAGDDDSCRVRAYSTAGVMVGAASLLGGVILLCGVGRIALFTEADPVRPHEMAVVFLAIGIGTLARTFSEWPAAAILAGGRIATDGAIQTIAEIAFVVTAFMVAPLVPAPVTAVAVAFALSSALLLIGRTAVSLGVLRPRITAIDFRLAGPILLLGGGVLIGQLADWLYTPLNQVLIHRFLDPTLGAAYAVAIQIDAGLLLAVTGLANVLMPTAAVLHGQGRLDDLRRRYVVATLAGLGLLAAGGVFVWAFASPIFVAWFGNSMPATRAILPWVLVHTVIGGTAATGRAVLLAIGEVRAYTTAAVVGGVANAVLALVLVTRTSLGLRGVVLATVVTVTVRCGLWMPWYTLRRLRPVRPCPI